MSAEDEVRKASKQFYAALSQVLSGDAGPMAEAWSHGAGVTAMHPIGGRELGWEGVHGSFAQVSKMSTAGHVELADPYLQVAGDLAYELGVEKGQFTFAGKQVAIEQRVTNVYRRDGAAWKLVHHHADISPAMLDLVRGLKA